MSPFTSVSNLNPDRTNFIIHFAGVVSAAAIMSASTCCTVQSPHLDGACHWASVNAARSAASAARSA